MLRKAHVQRHVFLPTHPRFSLPWRLRHSKTTPFQLRPQTWSPNFFSARTQTSEQKSFWLWKTRVSGMGMFPLQHLEPRKWQPVEDPNARSAPWPDSVAPAPPRPQTCLSEPPDRLLGRLQSKGPSKNPSKVASITPSKAFLGSCFVHKSNF